MLAGTFPALLFHRLTKYCPEFCLYFERWSEHSHKALNPAAARRAIWAARTEFAREALEGLCQGDAIAEALLC